MGVTGGVKRVEAGFPPQFAEYLDVLLSSPPFDSSPRRAELLRYLLAKSVAGQGNTLGEYAIALEVFRKPESFDQRIDSSVRSEVSRLRKIVAAYYKGSGVNDRWRIVFPARGYSLQIEEVAPPLVVEPPAPAPRSRVWLDSRWLAVIFAFAVILLAEFGGREYRATRGSAARNAAARPSPAHTPTPAAQTQYLRGQYYWEHRTRNGLQEAADAYTQAIVADSNYAAAYAGLAETYDLMPEYTAMPQAAAYSRAIAAADKAISLDPSISAAHRALAFGLFWSQTDAPRAFVEFRRAIQLAPNDGEAHHWYATALSAVQRNAEARSEIDLAQQLAPASRSILADQALIRYSDGDRQAKTALEELEAAEPDFRSPPAFLARIDLADGDYADYLEQLRRLAALSGTSADRRIAAAAQRGWASGGATGMLRAMQSVQKDLLSRGQSDGYDLAHTCGLLGEKEDAVRYLQKAFAAKDIFVLDALRQDWAPPLTGYPPFEQLRDQVRRHFGVEKGRS